MKKICITALLAFLFLFALHPYVQAQSVDFSGIWYNPFSDLAWRYKIIAVGDDIVIREFIPREGSEHILATGKLSGRNFNLQINTNQAPSGYRNSPGTINGRISDDNKTIYWTRHGKAEKLVRE